MCSGCERNFITCVWPDHITHAKTSDHVELNEEDMGIAVDLESNEVPLELCGVFEVSDYKHRQNSKVMESVISFEDQKMYDDLLAYKSESKFMEHNDQLRNMIVNQQEQLYLDQELRRREEENSDLNGGVLNPIIKSNWEALAIQIVTNAERKLSLSTRPSVKDFNLENLTRNLFDEFLSTYPLLFLFNQGNDIPSPFETFELYNGDFNKVLQSKNWLNQALEISILQIFECFAKLSFLVNKGDTERDLVIDKLQADIASIWTTIQTIEIQLTSTPSPIPSLEQPQPIKQNTPTPTISSTNVNNDDHAKYTQLIEFSKLCYMALQIFYLKIKDHETDTNSPVVGFYIDQFIASYESYLSYEHPRVCNLMFIFPLIINACASNTLEQREFISKELYLISYDLKLPFVEKIVNEIEESWGLDFNTGSQLTFNKLITGF